MSTRKTETQTLQETDVLETNDDFHSRKTEPVLPQILSHTPEQSRKTLPMFPPFFEVDTAPPQAEGLHEEGQAFLTALEEERCLAALEEAEKEERTTEKPEGGQEVDANPPEAQKHDGSECLEAPGESHGR